MMVTDQTTVFLIIGTALIFFVWGRLRYDLVAMVALMSSVLFGVVPADQAFVGFGHPAVITVATVLMISRALQQSGLVKQAARLMAPFAHNPSLHILALSTIVAFCSAFMNNVGALALMLPVAIQSACKSGRPTSEVLMPLSFGSLLGGLMTLIGTPPNIIISSYRATETGQGFAMFDFFPVGFGVAVVGLLFLSLVGWRFLPKRAVRDSQTSFHVEDYITEVRIPEFSGLVGLRLLELEKLAEGNLVAVALLRGADRMLAPSGYMRLRAGDILTLESDTATLKQIVDDKKLELVGATDCSQDALKSDRVDVVEAVITPGSRLEDRTAQTIQLHAQYGLSVLGVARQGQTLHERLGRVRFKSGDVLLVQGLREEMPETFQALGLLPLAERDIDLMPRRGSLVAPAIFALAILGAVTGLLPAEIAFVTAAGVMVLSGAFPVKDLYDSVDWSIIVLLGAMIPVGLALESTGGTAAIAEPLIALADHIPLWGVMAVMMLVTMVLSDTMNNAATAVLMAPIGLTIAKSLGAAVDPFLIAVAIGSSSTYLTPIGHQSNLLVMGPGGYRFGDYWRIGLPLDLVILLVSIPLILFFWPLT